ncbi:MAG: glucuronate isomerase [Deltaproteobacteria bacterium]|nr:glucuronate isomerase [Candidatus Zymogenaceae bacterium]
MTPFIHERFLLEGDAAQNLYREYAKPEPIIDYHNHLPPQDIAQNTRFSNIAEMWLARDHYKWRAMRTNGVDERLVTGDAPWREKFRAWAATVPMTLRNPLYHWTHLELSRYFGIDILLSPDTADEIYDRANEMLATDGFGARDLIARMNVTHLCTTDDPTDTLEYHEGYARRQNRPFEMYPAWRPDRALMVEDPRRFNEWVNALEAAADRSIGDFSSFLEALKVRHEFFHINGCRVSDYGLTEIDAGAESDRIAGKAFMKARRNKSLTAGEAATYRSTMLVHLSRLDHDRGWVQQFHIGALRNVNSRLFRTLGPDVGVDSIGDFRHARALAELLDRLDREGRLAKTVIYPINPTDNEVVATMIGNFQDGSTPGKLQFGSAWWFMDQKDGIENQLNILSATGLLSRFIGMTTDSRSVLSFPRHEYFRRILCNLIGGDMERGLIPNDMDLVGSLIKGVCYDNAARYFGFKEGVFR